ncbi:MAG: patatin family protein [Lachnospiraceae bacterium]|nr:patatin family protein [Lachnospiraceae bacterium]
MVLEGGAMRGMYTAGVLDVMMEQNICVDGVIGVSAGAVFGCNYISHQIGRTIRYNLKYCRDPRYMSVRSLLKTGDLYGVDFCYHELPQKLDPFDQKAFEASSVEFYVVCTDVRTGKAVYHRCDKRDAEDLEWMRASASMPGASRVVEIGTERLLDGGIADSIPLRYFNRIGYHKNIVVLTRPRGYKKSANRFLGLMKPALKKYPAVIEAMAGRHIMYNKELKLTEKLAEEGRIFLIRPSRDLKVGRTERNPKKLKALYQLGREDAAARLEEMRRFLQ